MAKKSAPQMLEFTPEIYNIIKSQLTGNNKVYFMSFDVTKMYDNIGDCPIDYSGDTIYIVIGNKKSGFINYGQWVIVKEKFVEPFINSPKEK